MSSRLAVRAIPAGVIKSANRAYKCKDRRKGGGMRGAITTALEELGSVTAADVDAVIKQAHVVFGTANRTAIADPEEKSRLDQALEVLREKVTALQSISRASLPQPGDMVKTVEGLYMVEGVEGHMVQLSQPDSDVRFSLPLLGIEQMFRPVEVRHAPANTRTPPPLAEAA